MPHMKMFAVILMVPLTALAQSAPSTYQHGPDLQFVCASSTGNKQTCRPIHQDSERYMHLANWRFAGSSGDPDNCVENSSYGYGSEGVWVSGDCSAVFQAPDLRYGDAFNSERLAEAVRMQGLARPTTATHP